MRSCWRREMLGKKLGSKTSASPEWYVNAWLRAHGALGFAREERGQAVIEFAMVMSLLMIILLGIISFGIAFNNQITLTNAANNAAQVVMSGPGVITDPCQ